MGSDELYGLPIEQFIPERTKLAKELRAAGKREEAAKVAALRKPSVAAWAVNQLVRTQGRLVSAVFEAGDALRAAHADVMAGRGDGHSLREASERQRAAVQKLADAARGLLTSEGHDLSTTVLDRVDETLRAAALDDEAREKVRDGRLERELVHVGLGELGAPGAAPPRRRVAKPAAPAREKKKRDRAAGAARSAERERERKAAAKAEADARRGAAKAARASAQRRKQAADALRKADLIPVAWVESPLTDMAAAPKQGDEGAPDAWVVFEPDVLDGLDGIAPGGRIILLTWLDRARRDVLRVHPRDDLANPERGVFSTRSADRPNPIGLHEVEVVEIAGDRVRVRSLEALDGTPVVDVKPVLGRSRG